MVIQECVLSCPPHDGPNAILQSQKIIAALAASSYLNADLFFQRQFGYYSATSSVIDFVEYLREDGTAAESLRRLI